MREHKRELGMLGCPQATLISAKTSLSPTEGDRHISSINQCTEQVARPHYLWVELLGNETLCTSKFSFSSLFHFLVPCIWWVYFWEGSWDVVIFSALFLLFCLSSTAVIYFYFNQAGIQVSLNLWFLFPQFSWVSICSPWTFFLDNSQTRAIWGPERSNYLGQMLCPNLAFPQNLTP